MSTMGIAVYCNNNNNTNSTNDNNEVGNEQLMLLRTLQDNERNIIASSNNNNNNRTSPAIAPKNNNNNNNNVSVINVVTSATSGNSGNSSNGQNENERRVVIGQNGNSVPYDPSRLKKHGKNGQPPPIAVAKRNLRERNRVKQVNNGFAKLRQHIPSQIVQGYGDRGKKLSKVETLRMALEYIRGLERMLAEADGLDYDSISAQQSQAYQHASGGGGNSPMIPSPTGSVYSNSTHNGSGDVMGLTGSELDEHQSNEHALMDDTEHDHENYLMEEDEQDNDVVGKERRDAKRFRPDDRSQNRLSENQNRTINTNARRNRNNSPATYYVSRQTPSFGDEENIEPLVSHNNNNNNNTISNNNNNTLLTTYSPILLQSDPCSPTSLANNVKREYQLTVAAATAEEDDIRRSPENEVIAPSNNNNNNTSGSIILSPPNASSPYAGEILIGSPETGVDTAQHLGLVPVKLEDADGGTQYVYVTATDGTLGLTTDGFLPTYYSKQQQQHHHQQPQQQQQQQQQLHLQHTDGPMQLSVDPSATEFMDVVSWWEQEQRFVHQLQNHHNHNNHHHHVVAAAQPIQHQSHHHHHHHQPTHQQLAAAGQRLAHV